MPLKENRVIEATSQWFLERGYVVAAMSGKKPGFDIRAEGGRKNETWLIEAKGGSHDGADKSNVAFSAVAAALLTVLDWHARPELKGVRLGVAIPRSKWFAIHAGKARDALRGIGATIFWVPDDGVAVAEHAEEEEAALR